MRKVDRAGGGDRDGRDGKRRHQELGALIDEPAQRDDGDRQIGCEGECSKHRAAAIKGSLVEKWCDLFPGPQREGAVSGVDAIAVGEEEGDRGGRVVGIGHGDAGSDDPVGLGEDPSLKNGGHGRDAGFRDENLVDPRTEYGQSGGRAHPVIGLHLSISDTELRRCALGDEGNPAPVGDGKRQHGGRVGLSATSSATASSSATATTAIGGIRDDGHAAGDGRVVDDGGDVVPAGGEGGGLVAEDVLEGDRVVPGGGIGIGEGDGLALEDDAGQDEGQLVGTGGGQPADRNADAVGRDGEGGGQARQERARVGGVRGQVHVLVEHQRDGVAGGADRGADKRGALGLHPRAYHLHLQRPAVRVLFPAGPVVVEERVGQAPAVRRMTLAIGADGP